MAKPNYSFEKRQRELAKKEKKAKKEKEKADRKSSGDETGGDSGAADDPTGQAAPDAGRSAAVVGPAGG